MSLSVVLAVGTVSAVLGVRWASGVLRDEERYLRAVAHLVRSQRFGRLAARTTALATRHHGGWRAGVSPRTAQVVALVTRRAVASGPFERVWMTGHRWVHRGRGGDRRMAVAMLALAATGEMVGIGTRLAGLARAADVRPRRASS